MRRSSVPRRYAGLQMTPMIDMAFLLITFFIMTIRLTASQGEEKVTLPHADQAQTTHESKLTLVTLVVDEHGRIFTGGAEHTLDGVDALLRARLAGGAEVKVVLRADRRSPFAQVRRLMRLAAENGIEKLSITALKLADGAPDGGES